VGVLSSHIVSKYDDSITEAYKNGVEGYLTICVLVDDERDGDSIVPKFYLKKTIEDLQHENHLEEVYYRA
jgi:hypothetical protein